MGAVHASSACEIIFSHSLHICRKKYDGGFVWLNLILLFKVVNKGLFLWLSLNYRNWYNIFLYIPVSILKLEIVQLSFSRECVCDNLIREAPGRAREKCVNTLIVRLIINVYMGVFVSVFCWEFDMTLHYGVFAGVGTKADRLYL